MFNQGLLKRPLGSLVLAILLAGAACTQKAEIPTGLDSSDIDSAAKQLSGVCRLLMPEEVELALNAPLGDLSPASRPVLKGMPMCTMGTGPKGSAISWGLSSRSGPSLFKRYAVWNKDYVEDVSGLGDKAIWDENLTTLIVLHKNRVLGVRLTFNSPKSKSSEPALRPRQTASALAIKILRRI